MAVESDRPEEEDVQQGQWLCAGDEGGKVRSKEGWFFAGRCAKWERGRSEKSLT